PWGSKGPREFKSRPFRNVRNCEAISTLRGTLKFKVNFLRPAMFYYVYILQSQKDKSFYIGYTTDLKKRFSEHNSGFSKATRPFRPYILVFYESFLNRIDAKLREVYLKSGYGRRTIHSLLK